MLVTGKCLNFLTQLLLLPETFEISALSDSKSMCFYHNNEGYLEGFPRHLENILRYLEVFLRLSGEIFKYVAH